MLLKAKKVIKYLMDDRYIRLGNDPMALLSSKKGEIEVTRSYFLQYLVSQTNFFNRIKDPRQRRNQINDTLNFCIRNDFIVERNERSRAMFSDIYLLLDIKGKQFIQPLYFLNAVLKEYGYIITVLLSGIFWIAAFSIGKIVMSSIASIFKQF